MIQRRLIKPVIFLFCALLFGCANPLGSRQVSPITGVEFIMNTWVEQRWYGKNAQKTYDEILDALKKLEGQLSLYRADSDISRLNSAAGKNPVAFSHETYQLLRQAVDYCAQTEGRFDITIAPLTSVWNVTSLNPHVPEPAEIAKAQTFVDYRKIIFDDEKQTVMLADASMSIDLGGIAKGYAAGLMREFAVKNKTEGYVSIGGNMMVQGKKPDKSDYVIGVRDPRGDASEYIASVSLDGYTMATTGDYERYFEQDGVRYHHILDPFTGYPVESDLISATVIAKDGMLGDWLSTAVFMGGSAKLNSYLNREDCMVIAVTRELDVYVSPALKEKLKINPEKNNYHFHVK